MKGLYICLGTRLSEMVEVGGRQTGKGSMALAMMMGYMDGHRYHDFTVRVSSRIEVHGYKRAQQRYTVFKYCIPLPG